MSLSLFIRSKCMCSKFTSLRRNSDSSTFPALSFYPQLLSSMFSFYSILSPYSLTGVTSPLRSLTSSSLSSTSVSGTSLFSFVHPVAHASSLLLPFQSFSALESSCERDSSSGILKTFTHFSQYLLTTISQPALQISSLDRISCWGRTARLL